MLTFLSRPDQPRRAGDRCRCVATQCVRTGIQLIAAVAALTEYAPADQRPQQPTQRIWVRIYPARQLIYRQRPVRKGISDAEFSSDRDRLRHPGSHHQLDHDGRRRSQPLVEPIQVVTNTLDHADELGGPLVSVNMPSSPSAQTRGTGDIASGVGVPIVVADRFHPAYTHAGNAATILPTTCRLRSMPRWPTPRTLWFPLGRGPAPTAGPARSCRMWL